MNSFDSVPESNGTSDHAFENLSEVRKAVEKNGGVLSISMQQLRDVQGAGRLGSIVRDTIARNLKALGLSHWPKDLPDRQNEYVRLYLEWTEGGKFVAAALEPGPSNDAKLRDALYGDSQNALEKMQEMAQVCEEGLLNISETLSKADEETKGALEEIRKIATT